MSVANVTTSARPYLDAAVDPSVKPEMAAESPDLELTMVVNRSYTDIELRQAKGIDTCQPSHLLSDRLGEREDVPQLGLRCARTKHRGARTLPHSSPLLALCNLINSHVLEV